MTEQLTYEKAVEYAEAVVAERGAGFAYSDGGSDYCFYISTTDPRFELIEFDGEEDEIPAEGAAVTGCLVGEILKRADLLTDSVTTARKSINQLCVNGEVPADPEARYFLAYLQSEQDFGASWSQALASAKENVQK